MPITVLIEGRNDAVKMVDNLCVKTLDSEPFAYDKLSKVRRYLRESTIQIGNQYFAD